MLSTPPAFNLSQNQTLQFKSVAKISVGRKSESQSSFPFAIHLSMNHTDSLGAKQLFTPLRFRCQQVFFIFAKVFFAAPSGQLVGARETYVSFSNPRQELFLPSGKISFPVALSDVASSLARTALCAFSTPPSSIFPQKILRICSLLTDHSINMPKRHRKMFAFFQATYCPLKKSRYRQCRNGPLAMHPPPCLSARLLIQRHQNAGGAPCQMPLPAP